MGNGMISHTAEEACIRLKSMPEAAGLLGVSSRYLFELIRRGQIPAVRIGRRVLLREEDLRRYVEQRVTAGGENR
jgi:excisionase family DNA binding protein